jgi:hypothetical protein
VDNISREDGRIILKIFFKCSVKKQAGEIAVGIHFG